jgi:hypothetical protein
MGQIARTMLVQLRTGVGIETTGRCDENATKLLVCLLRRLSKSRILRAKMITVTQYQSNSTTADERKNRRKQESMSRYCALSATTFLVGLGLLSAVAAAETQPPKLASGWHLVRTANPRGGPDAVSISHTADITRSDLDLAGMMLRCGEKSVEVMIVVVTPFSPRARPNVSVGADGKEWKFDAQVVSPGALLLPVEATNLANGSWQQTRELSVKVTSQNQSFGGVIPIEGLAEALATLDPNCLRD